MHSAHTVLMHSEMVLDDLFALIKNEFDAILVQRLNVKRSMSYVLCAALWRKVEKRKCAKSAEEIHLNWDLI